MTNREIKGASASGTVVVVPVGCTEQKGPVIGDAGFGSAVLGHQLHEEAVKWLAAQVEQLANKT